MSICFVNSQNYTQVINYIWLKGQATFWPSELLLQLFQRLDKGDSSNYWGGRRYQRCNLFGAGLCPCCTWSTHKTDYCLWSPWGQSLCGLEIQSLKLDPKTKAELLQASQQVASLFYFFYFFLHAEIIVTAIIYASGSADVVEMDLLSHCSDQKHLRMRCKMIHQQLTSL